MPTYEYRCNACGHLFEEFQMYSEEPLKKCPECKKKKLQRLFGTGGGIIFKGSGFYETDYRSDAYKNAAKADQEAGKSATESKKEGDKPATADKSATADKPDKPAATEKPAPASSGGDGAKKSEAKSPKSKK